jgi:hypothetical protein
MFCAGEAFGSGGAALTCAGMANAQSQCHQFKTVIFPAQQEEENIRNIYLKLGIFKLVARQRFTPARRQGYTLKAPANRACRAIRKHLGSTWQAQWHAAFRKLHTT